MATNVILKHFVEQMKENTWYTCHDFSPYPNLQNNSPAQTGALLSDLSRRHPAIIRRQRVKSGEYSSVRVLYKYALQSNYLGEYHKALHRSGPVSSAPHTSSPPRASLELQHFLHHMQEGKWYSSRDLPKYLSSPVSTSLTRLIQIYPHLLQRRMGEGKTKGFGRKTLWEYSLKTSGKEQSQSPKVISRPQQDPVHSLKFLDSMDNVLSSLETFVKSL